MIRSLLYYTIKEAGIEGEEQEAESKRQLLSSSTVLGLTPLHCCVLGGDVEATTVLLRMLTEVASAPLHEGGLKERRNHKATASAREELAHLSGPLWADVVDTAVTSALPCSSSF